ncbi:MAG TPA: PAS domain S-box protein [Rectinemataceae bacterium]|nr:PAS domain S-box protein [Rectinemataceae bacterium]
MESAKKNILIVDDEALIALGEARQLEKAGYGASYVVSGEKAIELVGKDPDGVDLILMDIDLGRGMDGTEAARKILDRFDIPVLFLSSHIEPEIVRKTESITNYGYVVKSSSFTVLDASIKMAFRLFEAHRRIALTNRETEAVNERLRESLERLQKAHDEIALSESKLSKIFQLSPDEITITRLSDGLYMDINEGYARLMGYERSEVIGHSSLPGDLDIWVHPEDRRRLLAIATDGEAENFETEFRKRDGSIITVSISAHLIDIGGERFIISITRDITDQRRMEERLQEAHAILDSTMDSQSDIYIISIDKDYRCLYRNRAYHDIKLRDFGVDVQVGTRMLDYIERDSFFQNARPYYDGALAGESIRVLEEYHLQEIIFEAMYSPIRSSGGEVIGATSFSVDITEIRKKDRELKESQERYQRLLNSVGEGFCYIDGNGIFRMTNPAAERILGTEPGSLVGRSFYEFFDEGGRRLVEGVRQRHRRGEPSALISPIVSGDGKRKYIQISSSPVREGNFGCSSASVVFREITDELRANEEMKTFAKRQETLMKELEHRVKNSLAIVSSLLGIATQEVSDTKALGVLRDTRSRIQSMSAIYERLYLTGKVESLDFGAYAESLAAAIFSTFSLGSDRIRLEVAVQRADLDTKRAISLGLIANELLTNCFKHAFPGGRAGKVRLELRTGQDRLILTVSDDGVGLSSPGLSATAATMGMMLIRELVDQIGGSIAVDASAGTSISVSLPRFGS